MADKDIDVYLNDHLTGAMLGSKLAGQIQARHRGTQLGEVMSSIAQEIEEDRETLVGLMQRMDAPRNPIKQASGWIAEKASRLKFGHAYRQPNHGAFMALEALTLGVHGKRSLWSALQRVANEYPTLASAHLDQLLVRAEAQHATLERERLKLAERTLGITRQ